MPGSRPRKTGERDQRAERHPDQPRQRHSREADNKSDGPHNSHEGGVSGSSDQLEG